MKITYRKVTRRGRRDGRDWQYTFWPFKKQKHREPKENQDIPAQYEKELLQLGAHEVSEIAEQWQEMDKKLKPQYCKALAARNHAEQIYKKEAGEEKVAANEYEAARKKYEELSPPALSPGWKWFWLTVLGLGEFPINAMIFQILGQGQTETYLFSGVMCLAIPLSAHFLGHGLRQDRRDRRDVILMVLGPLIMLGLLTVVALMRAKYFETVDTHRILGITITPTEGTIFFFVINLMIYFVALIISYHGSHPNHKRYTEVMKRYKDARDRLTKESGEARAAGEELKQADHVYQEIRQLRQKTHDRFAERAKTIQEQAEFLASAYRAANLAVRPDVPQCFKNNPHEIPLPASLTQLDWECEGMLQHETQSKEEEKTS